MTPVQEGEVLAGKYRVERVLGVGGMGVVVSALHLQLDERVALKFLLPEALGNQEAVARFAREARAAVKIKSIHVARVSDVGTLDTGAPYMVMEFLHGQDLSAFIRDHGPLPYVHAVDYVLQACEALAEAHALGIVHRDLKPANLFLITAADGSPCIKVLDFGISKITSPGSSGNDYGMTKTTAIMGSPLYMSPEQMTSSRDVDGRADIWAIGTILFELLAGRPPFLGETMPQLCGMILQEPPPFPRQFRPDLPEGLEAAILHCLEKDRTRRFANVAELAAALAPFGSANAARSAERVSKVLSAAGISSSQLEIPGGNSAEASTQSSWGKSTQKRGSGLTVIASLAVVVLIGAAALLLRHHDATPTADSATANTPPPSTATLQVTTAAPTAPPAPVAPVVSATDTASTAPASSATATAAPSNTAPVHEPSASKFTPHKALPKPPPAKPATPAHATTTAPTAPPAAKPVIDPLAGRR
ncbi:MAG TPA: serine/threonine-protein kinase [Polyangiaceae bacterium]|nr:serine/threonine-protein kinase [Polyangiaceae bacterium]